MAVDLFCSCDLDLDPMTSVYELDPYYLEIHEMCKYELPTSRLSQVIVSQTDRRTELTEIINYASSRVVNNKLNIHRVSEKNIHSYYWLYVEE